MKKKLAILLTVLCITQLLSSCGETPRLESDNYNYQVEIIYQQEGYVPSCAYQLFSTVYYKTGYEKLDAIGMRWPESSDVILDVNRELGEITFRTQNSIDEEILDDIKSFLTEAELEELSGLHANDKFLVYKDAIYTCTFEKIDEEYGDYQCYLVKYIPNEDVVYTSFVLDYSVISNSKTTGSLSVYSNGTICIKDVLWFNQNLEMIHKNPVNYEQYFLSEEEIWTGFTNSGLDKYAEAESLISCQGRFGDIFYFAFTIEVEEEATEYYLGSSEVYIAEMDMDGNLLSVIHIAGMNYWDLNTIEPKVLGSDGKYYDVKR